MKFKKILSLFMLVICCFALAGCSFGEDPVKYVETNDEIYHFYLARLLKEQNSMFGNIDDLTFPESEKLQINIPKSKVVDYSMEELAVVSAVECFNVPGAKKSVQRITLNGDLVFVIFESKAYKCRIQSSSGTLLAEYKFTVTSSDQVEYKVHYVKEIDGQKKSCDSEIKFDKSKSHLYIKFSTFNLTGENVTIYKDYYLLGNSFTILRINTDYETASSNAKYMFAYYREIIDYDLKITKVAEIENYILDEQIGAEYHQNRSKNDKSGFIVSYDVKDDKDGYVPSCKKFELDKWQ